MYESKFSLQNESHNLHQNGAEFHFAKHVIIIARCLIVDVVNCVNSALNVQLNQI